jgi:hypothetical protein
MFAKFKLRSLYTCMGISFPPFRSRGVIILCHTHQLPTTIKVKGRASATYSHHFAPSSIDMLKTEDKNVPGKKSVVRAAIVFIAVPSALASLAMVVLVVASCCVTRLKTCRN